MADQVLATEYIQFISKGIDDIHADMDKLRKQMDKQLEPITRVDAAMTKMKSGISSMVAVGIAKFEALKNGLMGFINAGLSGTAESARMEVAFQALSQGITAIFLPAIEEITDLIERLAQWFRNLTGEQQDWLYEMTGIPLVIDLFKSLWDTIKGIVPSFQELSSWATYFTDKFYSGLERIIAACTVFARIIMDIINLDFKSAFDLGKAKQEFAELESGMSKVRAEDKRIAEVAKAKELAEKGPKQRRDVSMAGGGFEDVAASFKRIQAQALKTSGKDDPAVIAKDQLAVQKEIADKLAAATRPLATGAAVGGVIATAGAAP